MKLGGKKKKVNDEQTKKLYTYNWTEKDVDSSSSSLNMVMFDKESLDISGNVKL